MKQKRETLLQGVKVLIYYYRKEIGKWKKQKLKKEKSGMETKGKMIRALQIKMQSVIGKINNHCCYQESKYRIKEKLKEEVTGSE